MADVETSMKEVEHTDQAHPGVFTQVRDFVFENWVSMIVGFVLASLGGVVVLYVVNFGHLGLSQDTDDWGSFGDYVGGVLNPIVAFAALAVLAYSVSIQRRELHEARKTMRAQADHAEDMVYLSALVAVIEYHERTMQVLQDELRGLPAQGTALQNTLVQDRKAQLQTEIQTATRKRDGLLVKVERMVEQTAVQTIRREARRYGF